MRRYSSALPPARVARHLFLAVLLLLVTVTGVLAAGVNPGMAKHVGDKAPIFAVATSQDTLADYNRDYYGQHHLVLSFMPAAFTPV